MGLISKIILVIIIVAVSFVAGVISLYQGLVMTKELDNLCEEKGFIFNGDIQEPKCVSRDGGDVRQEIDIVFIEGKYYLKGEGG